MSDQHKWIQPGTYIALDGLDGCGKSTQVKLLTDYIREHSNIDVVNIRQPGSSELSLLLRNLLLNGNLRLNARSELLMMAVSWIDVHLEKVIPALTAGKIVVSDRSLASLFAYQYSGQDVGSDYGIEFDLVERYLTDDEISNLHRCHRILILGIDKQVSMDRIKSRGEGLDNIERRGSDFFDRVYTGYESFSSRHVPGYAIDQNNRIVRHVDVNGLNIDQSLTKIIEELDRE